MEAIPSSQLRMELTQAEKQHKLREENRIKAIELLRAMQNQLNRAEVTRITR